MATTTPAERIYELISDLDTLDADQAKFAAEAAGIGGAAWAIERYAEGVIFARQMARIVRPILEARAEKNDAEWIEMVKFVRDDVTRQLVNGHWRANSTSLMQNAIHQWEAEAMARFIDRMKFARWE